MKRGLLLAAIVVAGCSVGPRYNAPPIPAAALDVPRVEPKDSLRVFFDSLKTEQARGSLDIARFYERQRRWEGAKIYYNEVLRTDPGSKYADIARERMDAIRKREAAN